MLNQYNHFISKLIFFVLFILVWVIIAIPPATAQPDSATAKLDSVKLESLFSVGLGLQHGFIFAHSQDVQNTSGARPTGIEAIFSWQRNDSIMFSLCHCYPRQGLMLAFYDYDVDLLGKSGTAAYFLEPTYQISDRVFFSLKAAAGFSYLNNPYDSLENAANQSYSTHVNAYLFVGVGVWFRLAEQWWLNPSINY